jgi:putative addiction module killer protein
MLVLEIVKTDVFDKWLQRLRDRKARARIEARIARLAHGNPSDAKPVGDGVSEMRIDHGPGYRVYYLQRGAVLAILLCGGDKSSQQADIEIALRIAGIWKAKR